MQPETTTNAPVSRRRWGQGSLQLATWVGAAEVVWLLLLGPLVLLPGKLLPTEWQWVSVAALLLFWPLRLLLFGTLLPPTPVRVVSGLFLIMLLVAIGASVDRQLSWEAAGYHLYGVALAAALVTWPPTRRQPGWIAAALVGTTVGLALIGPLVITESTGVARLPVGIVAASAPLAGALGETINPNILAYALLAGFPFLLALAVFGGWSPWGLWAQSAAAIAAAGVLAVLLFTDSRGAWLALVVVIPLLATLRWRALAYGAPLVFMAAATLAFLRGPALLEMLTAGSGDGAVSGFAQRVEIWQRGLLLVGDFPFTGAGLNTFPVVVPLLYPYFSIPPAITIPDAHNLPIQVAVDLGIPGLVVWLAFTMLLIWMAAAVLHRTHADEPPSGHMQANRARALAAGALASVVGGLVAGVFGATNWGVKPALLPWLVAALIVLLYAQARTLRPLPGAFANAAAAPAPRALPPDEEPHVRQ